MKYIQQFGIYKQNESISDLLSKYGNKTKEVLKKFSENLNKEAKDTKTASSYVHKYMKGETLTQEESDAVRHQFYDILKMVGIGVPFALVPGASILIPVLIKIAKKNGVELMPSSFR